MYFGLQILPKQSLFVKDADSILCKVTDDEDEINMFDILSDVTGTIKLDITHTFVTDEVSGDNPSGLPSSFTWVADDLNDVPLNREKKTAPIVQQ